MKPSCQLPIFRIGLKKTTLAIDNRPEFVYIYSEQMCRFFDGRIEKVWAI